MEVAREFALPVSFETIQYFRATFSYDAIVIRLNKDIDVTREWSAYAREAAKEARQRVQKKSQEEIPWADRHGLHATGATRRYVHPVYLPAAAEHREPNHPFQEHCRKNFVYRIHSL